MKNELEYRYIILDAQVAKANHVKLKIPLHNKPHKHHHYK